MTKPSLRFRIIPVKKPMESLAAIIFNVVELVVAGIVVVQFLSQLCTGRTLPRLARLVAVAGNAFVAVKGCNQGFWRGDLERVNGWDESFAGWGPEDKELCARLAHAGLRRRTLVFAGLAWHLHHPPAPRHAAGSGRALLARTRAGRRTRCETGLDSHRETSPGGA